jgi:transcriptional regulator with XRE-family HTH domain
MNRRGLNAKELAELAGISRSNISMILNGKAPPGFEFCKAIARAFDMPVIQVLKLAGLLEEEEEEEVKEEDDPIINEILEEARTLEPENRKQLLIFARWLRGQTSE